MTTTTTTTNPSARICAPQPRVGRHIYAHLGRDLLRWWIPLGLVSAVVGAVVDVVVVAVVTDSRLSIGIAPAEAPHRGLLFDLLQPVLLAYLGE